MQESKEKKPTSLGYYAGLICLLRALTTGVGRIITCVSICRGLRGLAMKLVLVMILLSYADLGFGVFASEAPGQRCVAMSSGSQDRLLVRTGGNVLVAGSSGTASSLVAGPSGTASSTSSTTRTI